MRITQTEMTLLVTPDMSNFGGKMHGGELLKLLDKVAYTCAMRYCGGYVVTLSVDKVIFKEPIAIGELLVLSASVNFTGRTSLEVGIRVTAENLETGRLRHTNSSYFTMVAVDKEGLAIEVETLQPQTEAEHRRWDKAKMRRSLRN